MLNVISFYIKDTGPFNNERKDLNSLVGCKLEKVKIKYLIETLKEITLKILHLKLKKKKKNDRSEGDPIERGTGVKGVNTVIPVEAVQGDRRIHFRSYGLTTVGLESI